MPKVVYITGAPASGKSTTTRLLREKLSGILVWEYGARLTEYLKSKPSPVEIGSQDDLRERSAKIVTPDDIIEVDRLLTDFVVSNRSSSHILIDSHPVTKESFGFRITPFSLAQFALLAPDEIWVFYTSPEEAIRRISVDSGGRPSISEEEARMHTALQASVAATYGMAIGKPVYLFDTTVPQSALVDDLATRLI